MQNGLLIAFAGVDGSGKTTQAKLLEKWLEKQRLSVFNYPKIPSYGSWLLDNISITNGFGNEGKDRFSKEFVSLVKAIDRVRGADEFLVKTLETRSIIITDRYFYCDLAKACREEISCVAELQLIYSEMPEPDYIIYLDTPVNKVQDRQMLREKNTEEYQDIVNLSECYRKLDSYSKFIIVENNLDIESVHNKIISIMEIKLNERGFKV
ncbi:dTMP kinase [Paenibacillaceae bacterium GAS479]|nr:dTMP kinase [Paenibacillaceae bacterium GAS479]